MNRSFHHITVSVPTRGAVRWQTAQALEAVRDASRGLPPLVYQPGNLSVAMTRNRVVRRFLDSECEVLVMVDDDIVPPPHFLEALLPPPQRQVPAGYGIVAVPHPHPFPGTGHLVLSAYRETSAGLVNVQEFRQGWNEVDAVATGCVAVPRWVLESLGPDPFRIAHSPEAPVTSDDFLFCKDVRAAGLKVGCWFDGAFCDHIQLSNLAEVMQSGSFGATVETAAI